MTTDPFAEPTAKPQEALSSGGSFVPLQGIAKGRLVLMLPVELERDVPSTFVDPKTGKLRPPGPRLTADIAVLSGEPVFSWLPDGATEAKTFDADDEADGIPHVFEGVWINSAPLIDRTEDARRVDLPATMSIGRLDKPKAYTLTAPSAKDMVIARTWLATPEGLAFKTKAQELHDARVAAVNGETPSSNPFP